jgi:hypothetical protein
MTIFKYFFGLVLCVTLTLAPTCSRANALFQATKIQSSSRFSHDAFASTLTLAKMIGNETPITLNGMNSATTISLPVAQLARIESATLTLEVLPSAALNSKSWLTVAVNGLRIGQINLGKNNGGHFSVIVPIPAHFLQSGYNTVTLMVAQHDMDHCEYPMSPELWTQIDIRNSYFTLYQVLHYPKLTLAQVGALFDPASLDQHPNVPIFFAGQIDKNTGTTLAYAAQGVARRYNYVPVSFSVASLGAIQKENKPKPPAKIATQIPQDGLPLAAVLIGSYAELRPYLANSFVLDDQKPRIILRQWGRYPARYLVMLPANTEDAQRQLALRFMLTELPLPARTSVMLDALILRNSPEIVPPSQLNAFQFRDLGFKSTTLTGIDAPSATLSVWNAGWKQKAQVRIHLSYAAGMSAQSALNVWINGALQGSIPLSQPQGGEYPDFAVTLPTTMLTAGWNVVRLQPILIPQNNGGDCKPFFPGNLAVTLFDDSSFIFMGGGNEQYAHDLSMLVEFNALKWKSGWLAGLNIKLLNSDLSSLAAAVTLMGKLSQTAHLPLINAYVGMQPPHPSWSTITLGALQSVSLSDRKRFGLAPLGITVSKEHIELSWLKMLPLSHRLGIEPWVTERSDFDFSHTTFAAVAADSAQPEMLFAAPTTDILAQGMASAVGFSVWPQLNGTLAYWPTSGSPVITISRTADPFRNFGLQLGLSVWMTQHPWYALASVLLFGVLTAVLIRWGVLTYRRRNHHE